MILGNRLSVLTKKTTPTKLKFHLTSNLTQPLYLTQSSANAVTVDWGDGSATEQSSSLAASFSHTYAAAGDYEVKVACADGEYWSPGGTFNSKAYSIGGDTTVKSPSFPRLTEATLNENTRLDISGGFRACTGLASVVLSDNLTSIGSNQFYGCTALESMSIPDGVTIIPSYMFYNCSALKSVYLPNGITGIENYAFYSDSQLASINVPTSISTIGDFAFFNCQKITTVEFPNTLTGIGQHAFTNTGIIRIVIPGGVTTINQNAFSLCTKLTEVVLQEGVQELDSAFASDGALTTIYFPRSLRKIYGKSFSDTRNIKQVHITDIDKWCEVDINNYDSDAPLYASSTASLYLNGVPVTDVVLSTATKICKCAFYHQTSLNSIVTTNNLKLIEYRAFCGCSGLTSINLPESIDTIERLAFDGCTSLNYAVYDNAKYLGNSDNPYLWLSIAIDDSITSCNIHTSAKHIQDYAFNSTHLTNIFIPNNIISIGKYSFSTPSLVSVTIGSGTTTIYDRAFSSSKLAEVHITDLSAWCNISFKTMQANPIYYAHHIYHNNSEIIQLEIPSGTTVIKENAFRSATSITSVILPSSISSIEDLVFKDCTAMNSITLYATVPPRLGVSSFSDTVQIYVLPDYVDIYKNDLNWSKYANRIQAIPS